MTYKLFLIFLTKLIIPTSVDNEGFIEDFEIFETPKKNYLLIFLKYKDGGKKPSIKFLKRISKPGRRIYVNNKNLPDTIGSFGIAIMSTSSGIMTDKKARVKNTGGEVLLYVY